MTFRVNGVIVQGGGPGDRLLLWRRVKDQVSFSRSTIWRMQRRGEFPSSVPASPGRVGWWESELDAWRRTLSPKPEAGRAVVPTKAGPRFRPAAAPKLPGMSRRSPGRRDDPGDCESPTAQKHPAGLSRPPPPAPSPAPAPSPSRPPLPKKTPRRRRPIDPAQTDFGF